MSTNRNTPVRYWPRAFCKGICCNLISILFLLSCTPQILSAAPQPHTSLHGGILRLNTEQSPDSAIGQPSKRGSGQSAVKLNENQAQTGRTLVHDSSGFEDEYELEDNDMYTPYKKWRIDKFDNWGRKRFNVPVMREIDTAAVDTSLMKPKKGFSDNEKETILFKAPAQSGGGRAVEFPVLSALHEHLFAAELKYYSRPEYGCSGGTN